MILHSIRWRLQTWHGGMLAVVVTALGVTAYLFTYHARMSSIDYTLQRRLSVLASALPVETPSAESTYVPSQNLYALFGSHELDTYYVVWRHDGNVMLRSVNAPSGIERPETIAEAEPVARTRGAAREFVLFTPSGGCIVVGQSIARALADLRRLAGLLALAGGGVLAAGLAGGWWLTARSIRSIDVISAAASRIAAGDLTQRIDLATTDDELSRLGSVLNSTFARLEDAFARQVRFTSDASHELRTPLTVIVSEAQTALARDRAAGEYRASLETCLAAAQQMRQLTASLLELARFDSAEARVAWHPIDLADLTRGSVARVAALAAPRGVLITCELAHAGAHGDREQLDRVVTNLLANAVQYNRSGGEVLVSTRSENGSAVLTISDTGIGISADDLPHVFERFYRADKSRARGEGRSGLGLAICKAIVNAHGGTIDIESAVGRGTLVTVRLAAGDGAAMHPEPTGN